MASVPTLTEFLLARIAEDEAVARAASIGSSSWHLGEFDETILWWPPSSPEKVAKVRQMFGDELAADHDRWSGQTIESSGPVIAPHIARFDPARVLAEVEAKRRIMELANAAPAGYRAMMTEALCAIALPYANHPDYRQEWKP